jgi:hypothetical protein
MRRIVAAGALGVVAAAFAAASARAELVETRSFDASVPIDGAGALEVVVCNVFGSIRVTAHDGASVDLKATETIRAETEVDLTHARAEAALRTEHEDGRVAFRARRCGCDCGFHRWDGYVVEYDIELRVPREASLDLSTVNDGEVAVDGVEGDFRISNVNGPVRLAGLRGAGHVRTVNGPIDTTFERAPATGTAFESVNGRIQVSFPSDLSADLQFKTMRGEIWTDFDAAPLPATPVRETERDGSKYVIRAERRSAVRVGSGGPTHSFETMNGDIYVRSLNR